MIKNNKGKIQNFRKSTTTNSPTGFPGETKLPNIGDSFIYIETSSKNHGKNDFVSFERTNFIQISNKTFYYNRFSNLINDSLKSTGCFGIQLLLGDNTWSTRYNIPKIDRYSNSPTQWTKLGLNFTVEICDIKVRYEKIDSAHADMCSGNITTTHSVY